MNDIKIQQVIDLTSLLGRRDIPAIQTAITNPERSTPFLNRLSLVLRRSNLPWQLKDLKEQTLYASESDLRKVQNILFDNKIWFKTIQRSIPYQQAKVYTPFYFQNTNSR